MRSDVWRAARSLFLPTLALVAILAFLPGWFDVAIRVYALLVTGVTLVLMIAALRRAYPPARPLRKTGKRQAAAGRERPAMLARLEQEVVLGTAGSFDTVQSARTSDTCAALVYDICAAGCTFRPRRDVRPQRHRHRRQDFSSTGHAVLRSGGRWPTASSWSSPRRTRPRHPATHLRAAGHREHPADAAPSSHGSSPPGTHTRQRTARVTCTSTCAAGPRTAN